MAILIGVIALAVLPNIQRSRESKDISALDSIASAANAAVATTQAKGEGVIVLGTCAAGISYSGAATPSTEQEKIWKNVVDTVATNAGKTESDATNGCSVVLAYKVADKKIEVAYVSGTVTASTTYSAVTGVDCKYLDGKFEVKN